MPKVKQALIMAAGKGTRMEPLTLETPKPLVKVHGKPMIETIIDALHAQGITRIGVVTGYLADQFSALPDKYPDVELINNPWFDTCNNISSLYAAKDWLEDVLILDGDQIIADPSVLNPEFSDSGYACIWSDGPTDEWVLDPDEDVFVKSCSRTGADHGYRLLSVSWWTKEDGQRLQQDLEEEFIHKKNTDIYWDDVAMFCHPDHYRLKIHPIPDHAVTEIDSLEELCQMDPSYRDQVKGGAHGQV